MDIPEWKWDRITMDFMVGLPLTLRKFDAIWVIVDQLTKSAHFIPVCTAYSSKWLAEIYIREIVRLHGVPVSIISDRALSLLRNFGGLCSKSWLLSYQSSIQMAPYEDLSGRRHRSSVGWFEPGEARLLGTDLVQDALEKVKVIQEMLHTPQSRQKSYADRKVRDVSYMVGKKMVWTGTTGSDGKPLVPLVRAIRGRCRGRGHVHGKGRGVASTVARAAPIDPPATPAQEQVPDSVEPVGPALAPTMPIVIPDL
ncbi:uncharacterized protein [Nicotiana sylvestris]|uniref:uncharacterized protein n=1 Tax=Nicotiana sylvestris TaxID=4096 RepID=UPI00388C3DAD